MKKLVSVLLAAAVAFSLTGCTGGSIYSNYRELEELSVVQSMGFDYNGEEFELSVSTGKGGYNAAPKVSKMHASAQSIARCEEIISDYSASEQIFYAHTSYIAIGEASCKRGLAPFLDYIERSGALRIDTPLFIVRGERASALILGAGNYDYDSTSVLKSLERNIKLRGDLSLFTAGDAALSLSERGCALLTAVKCERAASSVEGAKRDELTAVPDGYAVIKNDRAVGEIGQGSAIAVNVLTNRVGPSRVVLDGATVQIDKSKAMLTPKFKSGSLEGLEVKIELTAALVEMDKGRELGALERELEKNIERDCLELFALEKSLGCDLLGSGGVLELRYPQALKGAGRKLGAWLPTLYINVGVSASISRSFDSEAGSHE